MPLTREFNEMVQPRIKQDRKYCRNSLVKAWSRSWPEISIREKRFCATTLSTQPDFELLQPCQQPAQPHRSSATVRRSARSHSDRVSVQ